MDQIISSGKILLERDSKGFKLSKKDGSSYNKLVETTLDHFDDLRFAAKCLNYNAANLGRTGLIGKNDLSIKTYSTVEYDIELGLNSVTLSKVDMADLMRCIKMSDGCDQDEQVFEYGLKKDDRPTIRTVRMGNPFPEYVPNIVGDHFALATEKDDQVRVYLLTDAGAWVDIFSLYDSNDVCHIKQVFSLIRDSMEWDHEIHIESHCGMFTYDPEHDDCYAKIRIEGKLHLFEQEDISDLIRVFDMLC